MGWQDVKDTYKRSTLGPLWLTVGLGVQITAIGLLFPLLFGSDVKSYFPFVATSFVLWFFIINSLNESTTSYVQSERMMKQMAIPGYFPVLRSAAKNFILFLHNLVLIPIVMVVFGMSPSVTMFAAIFGIALLAGNLFWLSVVLGVISARYRDFTPIVSSLLMLSFYVTPILWMPESVPERFRDLILNFNPFYHLMDIVRAPLLGSLPSPLSILWSVGLLFFGGILARWVLRKFSWKIVYWL